MKRIAVLAIISLMLMSSTLFSFSARASVINGGTDSIPQPGKIEWGEWFKDSEIQKHGEIKFVQNDAYPGWATYPYQFEFGLYHDLKNQRVTLDVWLRNGTDTHWDVNGDGYCEINYGETSDQLKKLMRARLYQPASWKNETYGHLKDGDTGFIAPDMAEQFVTGGSWAVQEYQTNHWRFTFLTNSSSFSVGVFAIEIQMKITWRVFLGTKTTWSHMANIYGEFTVGDVWVPPDKPPNDVYYNEKTHSWPPAYFNFTIQYGKYKVKFWYGGTNGSWEFNNTDGTLKGPEVKLMQTYPTDGGYYTKDDSPVHISYPFNGTQPAGEYIWEIISYSHDGEYLFSWTRVIINNATSEDISPNGTVGHPPPKVVIGFDYTGTPAVNKDIYIVIKVYSNDSSEADIWVDAFYGANLYMAPPPWLGMTEFYNHPARASTDGTPVKIPVRLRYGGQFNVYVSVRDDKGGFGGAENFLMVKDFQGSPGGNNNKQPSWFKWPWESTTNMVILFFGVILLFSRRPTLQIIGIALFFAAFVDWGYVGQQIQAGVNPLNWFKKVII